MNIIVVSDVHGSEFWKSAARMVDTVDKVVFLGDYFDTWVNEWPQQMDNARGIVQLKKDYPGKIDLCWGNHDISYLLHDHCSGYQMEHDEEIIDFFKENKEFFKVVYMYDKWLFSHAGVSKRWMEEAGLKSIKSINKLFTEKGNWFRWRGPDVYGDNPNEGPLWIRPSSLIENAIKGYKQVVGHTEQPDHPKAVSETNQFVFCDTRGHNFLTMINTAENEVVFERIRLMK